MSAKAVVIALLLAADEVTDIVGAKIRPTMLARDDRPPGIIVSIVATSDTPTLSGPGGYYRQRTRVECIHTSDTEADALGDIVIETLNGTIKATVAGATDVDVLLASTDYSDFAEDLSTFRRIIEFNVRWRKAD